MKKTTSFLTSLFVGLLLFTGNAIAQVTIGGDSVPDKDAVLHLISNENKGLLLPRLELVGESDAAPLSRHVEGMVVYNISGASLPVGYYYNTGAQWVRIGDANAEAWYDIASNKASTSYLQDIYHEASVAIGTKNLNKNTLLQLNSTTKGVLIPSLSNNERNSIGSATTDTIPDGLMVYNKQTGCFNYYQATAGQWLSLCGGYDPAVIEFADCSTARVNGTYRAGTALGTNNTYELPVNVATAGSYKIDVKTINGYLFSASGTFTNAGPQLVVLKGEGTPISASQAGGDPVMVAFNNTNATMPPTCVLPRPTVAPASTVLRIDCGKIVVSGTYKPSVVMDGTTNFATVPFEFDTNSLAGSVTITTSTANGVTFSGTQTVNGNGNFILRASGTPSAGSGTYTYRFTIPGTAQQCSFDVEYKITMGTETDPAKSCFAILQADANAKDGVYWVKNGAGAIRTFCDMTNGGYTLIQSYSEYALFNVSDAQFNSINNNQPFFNDKPQGTATAANRSATMPYDYFRLPTAAMTAIAANGSAGKNVYRWRVVQDASLLETNDDEWAKKNNLVIDFTAANSDPLKGGFCAGVPNTRITGKLLGYDFSITPGTGNGTWTYGISPQTTWTSPTNGNGFWICGGGVMVLSFQGSGAVPNQPFTYEVRKTDNTYTTVNSNVNDLNDITGPYGAEQQLNHMIGKCGNSTADDYAGVATCVSTRAARKAHSFNSGQGRYIQWFVK